MVHAAGRPQVRLAWSRGEEFNRRLDDAPIRGRHASLLKVLVSGSSGLLGSHLVAFLRAGGVEVSRLVRHTPRAREEIQWDPVRDVLDTRHVEGLDAVVHLAGESLAGRRWSERPDRLATMSKAAFSLARPDAAAAVIDACARRISG